MAAATYKLKSRGKNGILWVRFTAPGGSEVYRSSGTSDKALATEWASKLHAEYYRVARLGEKPRRTWQDAVTAWLTDHGQKRSLKKDIHNLRWLDPHFRDKYLDEIDADALKAVSDARRSEPKDKRRRKDGTAYTAVLTSQATVDKMLALVRSILKDAQTRGWIGALPSIKLTAEAPEDFRWLTRDEASALYEELAEHLRPIYLFALATGLREQNVLRLEWSKVDIGRRVMWVKASSAKGKKALGIPLNRNAVDVLKAQDGKHGRWVFPNDDGKPFDRANNHGFKAAQRRAKVAPLTWHDLRHTWASWHVMAGTSLRTLMELGGWRSIQSVMRYAHLSAEHLAKDAERVGGLARNLPERN